MRTDTAVATKSSPADAVVLATLLAILTLATVATVTANAQEARDDQAYGSRVESDYHTDEADAGFFDFSDGEFGDSTALGDDDFGDVGFGSNAEIGGDEGFVDVEEDVFNFDAEYGQDYDEQLVSDQADDEYRQDLNVFETDETWFEDWFDE